MPREGNLKSNEIVRIDDSDEEFGQRMRARKIRQDDGWPGAKWALGTKIRAGELDLL